jgi:hypothetical protein
MFLYTITQLGNADARFCRRACKRGRVAVLTKVKVTGSREIGKTAKREPVTVQSVIDLVASSHKSILTSKSPLQTPLRYSS